MQSFGVLSIIFLIIALVYMLIKWPIDITKPFSQLAARKQSSIIYYAVIFVLFLIPFSVYMVVWFIPEYTLNKVFSVVFFIGVLSQLIAVFVPETGGVKTKIHIGSAGVMSVSALIMSLILSFGIAIGMAKIIATIMVFSMLFIWLAYIAKFRITKYASPLQSVYFLSFFIAIMSVTYLV